MNGNSFSLFLCTIVYFFFFFTKKFKFFQIIFFRWKKSKIKNHKFLAEMILEV